MSENWYRSSPDRERMWTHSTAEKGPVNEWKNTPPGSMSCAFAELLAMGSERRGLNDEGWNGEQNTGELHVVAFSLLPVEVEFAGEQSTLLAPTTVAFTRPEFAYIRSPQNTRGQRTIFVGMDTQTAIDVCEIMGQSTLDKRDPFPTRVGPCSAKSLAMAMQLDRLVFENDVPLEPLEFEEYAMRIVEHALDTTYQALSTKRRPHASKHKRRSMVDRVLGLVCNDPAKKWSLAELAISVELSPAYLSRIFRSHTGRTLTQCLMLIRVIRAMEQLPDRRGSLAALALDCGLLSTTDEIIGTNTCGMPWATNCVPSLDRPPAPQAQCFKKIGDE